MQQFAAKVSQINISHALEVWAISHGAKLDFIKPRKPTQSAYIELFNRIYKKEVLDYYLFKSSTEYVKEQIDGWSNKVMNEPMDH